MKSLEEMISTPDPVIQWVESLDNLVFIKELKKTLKEVRKGFKDDEVTRAYFTHSDKQFLPYIPVAFETYEEAEKAVKRFFTQFIFFNVAIVNAGKSSSNSVVLEEVGYAGSEKFKDQADSNNFFIKNAIAYFPNFYCISEFTSKGYNCILYHWITDTILKSLLSKGHVTKGYGKIVSDRSVVQESTRLGVKAKEIEKKFADAYLLPSYFEGLKKDGKTNFIMV